MPDDRVPMQLAVAGELGPVLRSALTTRAVRLATSRTVLRISAPPDVDVLAVMRACDVEGLTSPASATSGRAASVVPELRLSRGTRGTHEHDHLDVRVVQQYELNQ